MGKKRKRVGVTDRCKEFTGNFRHIARMNREYLAANLFGE